MMKGLYAIIDPDHCAGRDPLWVAEQVLAGGCAALQLRAKNLPDRARLTMARILARRCQQAGVPFWMNDRVDLALLVEADGVHLGQEDIPLEDARKLFPHGRIGVSTHDLQQAESDADVLGFGPVYPTRSKLNPDPVVGLHMLRALCAVARQPVIAIGGIELANAREVAATGASYAAAIGALCRAEDPRAAARDLHGALCEGSAG